MSDYCVVLVNGVRARFFSLEAAESAELEGGPNLKELEDLVNLHEEGPNGELWTNVKSGRNRAPGGGPAHGYDDHRLEHSDEFKRRFARDIAKEATRLVKEKQSRNIVLATEKRMLGFLRVELDALEKTGVKIQAITKDISKLSPQEVHSFLAKEKLIPPRRMPGG